MAARERPLLLLRFHSLGDVVLTTGIARALSERLGTPIDVATERRFLPVYGGLPWVDRCFAREEVESWQGETPRPRWASVVDLQGSPSSRKIAGALGPVRTLAARSAARRWLVLWGDRFPRPSIPHVIARYAEAAGLDTDPGRHPPEVRASVAEEEAARQICPWLFDASSAPRVGILPGASRRTKTWPPSSFAELAAILAAHATQCTWFSPPGEDPIDLAQGVRRASLDLAALKGALGRLTLVVSGDSGPMHLAGASRVPVVAVFGSSVRGFGFTPLRPVDLVLEVDDLACRPCGVHGRDRCWLGHWRCVRDLSPRDVAARVLGHLHFLSPSSYAPTPAPAAGAEP